MIVKKCKKTVGIFHPSATVLIYMTENNRVAQADKMVNGHTLAKEGN